METKPFYKLIFDELSEKIASGELAEGAKVPTEKELCEQFNVSRITGKRVLDMLAEKGLIVRFQGKGSFVRTSESAFGKKSTTDAAKSSRSIPSRSIAFITPDFSDAFGVRLLYGIEDAAAKHGFNLIIKCTHDSIATEEKAMRSLSGDHAEGLLIIPAHGEYYSEELLRQIVNKRPIVLVDRSMQGIHVPSVLSENVGIGEIGTRHLLELGHRNILFCAGNIEHVSSIEDRKIGYMNALSAFDVKIRPHFFCPHICTLDDVQNLQDTLKKHPELTAAFTTEFSVAVLLKTAVEQLGRSVPQDFSIVTVDMPSYPFEEAFFTHVKQDEYEIGKQAVETLLEHISLAANPAYSIAKFMSTVSVPVALEVCKSTRPIARENR
ncbi:MAG: GntR family transcriptional regulator [Treponemataceae bacterium]|nr:MAG: GntR family transcriptional regulator [Treponemataceae bacterium]